MINDRLLPGEDHEATVPFEPRVDEVLGLSGPVIVQTRHSPAAVTEMHAM
jgi:hypothetical protein